MNNMPSRTNKDSDPTEDSDSKKSLQADSDSSEESQDDFDGSDKDNDASQYEETDTSQYEETDTSPYEESGTSSDSSQDSQSLELPTALLEVDHDEEEGDKDTSSDSSDSSQDSPNLEIPKALLEVDPNDQESVVKAIGLLITMINSQLNTIKSKVLPKSPLDFIGDSRQKKLWRMRRRDRAQYKDGSE
ncbi:clumping factor B isoform X2 [Drosophila teissieri]|uniref:clumping factor B isoform X2 n=1 Tax=Drosophila teissieri TaxID=7243 RepID=UPI001CBA2A21|nr:clumping factor B isoform X2 [Drosophila teissieri]